MKNKEAPTPIYDDLMEVLDRLGNDAQFVMSTYPRLKVGNKETWDLFRKAISKVKQLEKDFVENVEN